MTTLLTFAPAEDHTKPNHPENSGRFSGLLAALRRAALLEDLRLVEPVAATLEQVRRVHSERLVGLVRQVSERGGGLLDYGDTYATADSYRLALLAAGGCCAAVDLIAGGGAANGLALVRPPGHHAERDRAGGFCLFNNVAIAARQLQAVHGVQRVLIVDFDVHHGNGTQDVFYRDETVLFISVHLFTPFFYPGAGRHDELGAGRGRGYTLNVPLPPMIGDKGYLRVFEEVVKPAAVQFRPQFILVSVGFDAHWQDPLASAGLSLQGYARLSQALLAMADRHCAGRILFILEGGYKHDVLTHGITNLAGSLLGRDTVSDPMGAMPGAEADVARVLARAQTHDLLS